MNEPKRAGLVGAGYVSEFHIKALRRLPHVAITGIVDVNAAAAGRWGLPVYASLEKLVEAGANVIHVLTPPASHAAIAIEALRLGCDVLVEKPLATSVEDCDRIAEAAKNAGKTVCVNHSLLYDPFIVRALNAVRAGAVGNVLTVDYFRSSEYPPYLGGSLPPQCRDGGYPFRDLGVHALYLMREFLGEIQSVEADFRSAGKASRDPLVHFDEWRARVQGERGTGQIQLSWNVRPMQHQLFVQGTTGTMRVDLFSMFVASRQNTPLPKSIERGFNALNEARQISFQTSASAVRFLAGRLMPYHGLQMLVEGFYKSLPKTPVSVADARPIVEWTERVARPADAAKTRFAQQFEKPLTAPVLVTGAGGFIGRHLVERLLANGQCVRVLVRRAPPTQWMNDNRVEIVLGDLGDPAIVDRAIAGTEIVYHLGAAMSGRAEDFQRGTVTGTQHVLNALRRQHTGKLVYVSSLSVLHAAAATAGMTTKEDWPLEPRANERGAYTQTKLAAEELVRQATDIRSVILRPGQVFGQGAPLLTPAVARRMGPWLVILGSGDLVLPLVYVEDVVDAILLAARTDVTGVFHLVDKANVTQNELAGREDQPLLHVPLPVVYALAWGVEVLGKLLKRPVPITRYRVKSALAPLSFDSSAARDQLGWKPRIGVRAGLEKMR